MITRQNKDTLILDEIKAFIDDKRAGGLTTPTLNNYTISLQKFVNDNDLTTANCSMITKDLVNNWITSLLDIGANSNSIKHYIREVRVFLYWLMEQDKITSFKVKIPSLQDEYNLDIYTESEVATLLVKPAKTEPYWVFRDWLLCNIMVATGARVGSLCNLHKSDITDNSITFNKTKTKKVLTLPLSPALKQALNYYYNCWQLDSDIVLLSTKTEDSTGSRMLYHSFQKYCALRGVTFRGLHSFRHFVALNLYKQGTDIVTIQTLLGHNNIQQTRDYMGRLTGQELPVGFTSLLDRLSHCNNKKITRITNH